MTAKKLKYGILCNSTTLQQWQAAAIQHLFDDIHFELCLVVVNTTPHKKESLYKKIFSNTLLFRQYETRFLKIEAKQGVDMTNAFASIPTLKVSTVQKGKYSQYFAATDVEEIKQKQLDFIIRFGFGILKGDILDAAKYGIWSYHHGDEVAFRGGPPGFWEIMKNAPTTACILQRLTPTLDGGIVLKKGIFSTTNHSYAYQLNTLFSHTSVWIKQVGLDILYNNKQPTNNIPKPQQLPINKAPKNFTFLWFLLLLLLNKLKFRYNALFRVELWAIGLLQNKKEELFNNSPLKVEWLEDNERYSYRADPFIMTTDSQKTIFFERYNYNEQKGHIASLSLKQNATEQVVLKNKNHFSYPFIFNYNGTIYCLPESYTNNAAQAYSITSNLGLGKPITILNNIEAVDSSLLYYNNKFWLFCTINNALHNAQLFIFYSDSLSGDFTPHLLNPVKTDCTSARPAGSFFEIEGSIIRPSQNCGTTYGGSLMLNKIDVLSETDYKETLLKEIKPISAQYPKGLHHICVDGDTIIIDSKKYIYSLRQAIKRLVG